MDDVLTSSVMTTTTTPMPITCSRSDTHSLGAYVASLLASCDVLAIYWRPPAFGREMRVHIVIAEPDFAVESEIYGVQLAFMDRFPELPVDWAVIFASGRPVEELAPTGFVRVR